MCGLKGLSVFKNVSHSLPFILCRKICRNSALKMTLFVSFGNILRFFFCSLHSFNINHLLNFKFFCHQNSKLKRKKNTHTHWLSKGKNETINIYECNTMAATGQSRKLKKFIKNVFRIFGKMNKETSSETKKKIQTVFSHLFRCISVTH